MSCALFLLYFLRGGFSEEPQLAHGQELREKEAAAQALLLDGVRAFRAERYADALGIFRRVEAQKQPGDIGFYLGMCLHKLGRHAEALGVFRAAHRAGLREPVADYYQAVSAYRLGLMARAQRIFLSLSQASQASQPNQANQASGGPALGPRLQQGARSFLQAIELAVAGTDAGTKERALRSHFETTLARAAALPAGSEEEALEWLDESVQVYVQLPERNEVLPSLRQALLRLREALRNKPAEADVLNLLTQVGT